MTENNDAAKQNQISNATVAIRNRKAREAHQYKRIRDAHINNINSRCNHLHIGG